VSAVLSTTVPLLLIGLVEFGSITVYATVESKLEARCGWSRLGRRSGGGLHALAVDDSAIFWVIPRLWINPRHRCWTR
jgi:hypothetical protein